jgi:hypothetical protein
MVYLTKKDLCEHIQAWMSYEQFWWNFMELFNFDTPEQINSIEWFYRTSLTNAIILHEMQVTDTDRMSAEVDCIESFEMVSIFDDIVYEARKNHHNAEWIYDNFIKEWYHQLELAQESIEDEN